MRRSTVQIHIRFIQAAMVGIKSMIKSQLVPEFRDIEIVISHLEEVDNLLGNNLDHQYFEYSSYQLPKNRLNQPFNRPNHYLRLGFERYG